MTASALQNEIKRYLGTAKSVIIYLDEGTNMHCTARGYLNYSCKCPFQSSCCQRMCRNVTPVHEWDCLLVCFTCVAKHSSYPVAWTSHPEALRRRCGKGTYLSRVGDLLSRHLSPRMTLRTGELVSRPPRMSTIIFESGMAISIVILSVILSLTVPLP